MRSPIERIKLSKKAKDQLIKLRKVTKIEQWNILCRWGFCRSLREKHTPAPYPIPADSNVEMSWNTFGGEIAEILLLALIHRCYQDGFEINAETLNQQFRLHLHRGINYLVTDLESKTLSDFVALGIKKDDSQ
ncbi:DNA sulfur modification protein DndE [Cyanobacterium sp. Dongsha4]|uniref:DNA sulfur modification protein DndE n=1 Tax=Cyanobacterium sp. DS4 TaxID=2878255 RepID=UPI002E80A33E|nr:DNA sulfur modification protein DndE [Cyanobacterium sp. Dongsha4]WVL02313.1 DNA sulfur modification protein DndE [Cyanobacterium sp. Dongsha4]